ncbi:MAG: helix-turn-helix transcriptional regulator, partial [Micromonosporaceae bacterium]
ALLVEVLVGRWRVGAATGDPGCERHLHRASELAADLPLATRVVEAREGWARSLARQGDALAAVSVVEKLREEVERAGRLHDLAWLMYSMTTIYERAGRCAEARDAARQGGALLLDLESMPGLGLLLQGIGELTGGSLQTATGLLDEALAAHAGASEPEWLGVTLLHRGRAHLAAGEYADAAAVLRRCQRALTGRGYADPAMYPFDADLAEALVSIGEPDAARDVLDDAHQRATHLGRDVVLLGLARVRAVVRLATGDRTGSATALRDAITAYASRAYPVDLARAWLTLASLERRNRRRAPARAAVTTALQMCDVAGATVLRNQVIAEQARIDGVRDGASLTATERRIVEQVRAGATNQEIATTLFLSVKAVEGTLTRLYRQLGVRNRTELARTTDP